MLTVYVLEDAVAALILQPPGDAFVVLLEGSAGCSLGQRCRVADLKRERGLNTRGGVVITAITSNVSKQTSLEIWMLWELRVYAPVEVYVGRIVQRHLLHERCLTGLLLSG